MKFFLFSYVPAPNTVYKNIYQLQPGENITINLKSLKIDKKKYWEFENGPDYNMFFSKTSLEQFKTTFNNMFYSINRSINFNLI